MATTRKYISKTAAQLGELFEANQDNPKVLRELLSELKHRSTPSAKSLRVRVEAALNGASSSHEEERPFKDKKEASTTDVPKNQTVTCRNCDTNLRVPVRTECIAYTCPTCKAEFETVFKNGVFQVTWVEPDNSGPDSYNEEMTDAAARNILGVSPDADFIAIKAAWRKASQQYHPDKHQGLPTKLRQAAEAEMKRINEAYRFLERSTASEF